MRAGKCIQGVLRFYLRSSLLGLLLLGCNGNEVLEPTIDAASSAAPGSKITAPSSTKAVGLSPSQIDVTWQDNSSNETGFEVHTGTGGTFALLASVGAGVTQYIPGTLTPLTQYCYKVRAFRTTGSKNSYSAFANTACGTTLPPVAPGPSPGGLARSTNSTTVEVTWSDTSSNEDGFRVERSTDGATTFALATTTGPNARSFTDGDRISERMVCYRVVAFNGVGESPPKGAGCATPPLGPTDLTAAKAGLHTVALAWRDRSAVEWGYELQRSTAEAGPFATIATFPTWGVGTVSYMDTVPSSSTLYWYRARALTSGEGVSDFSNTASASGDPVPPNAPGPVEAQPFATYLDVAWSDNSINEQGFRVERSTDDGASWVVAGTNGANAQIFYENWSSTEQQVCYRIIAFNGIGNSPASPIACTALPAAPGPLTATAIDDDTIELVWPDNSSFEDSYEVLVAPCGGLLSSLAVLPADATTFRISGINQSAPRFLVRALKGQWGYSHYSNEAMPYPDGCQF